MGAKRKNFSAPLRQHTPSTPETLQDRISQFESRIRRRIYGKIRWGSYDMDDVLASVRRRLHAALINGQLELRSDRELEVLTSRMAHSIMVDAIRRERRLHRLHRLVGQERSDDATSHSAEAAKPLLETLMRELDDVEAEAMQLYGRGLSHTAIAKALGLSIDAYRSRWRRLRERCRLIVFRP